MKVQTKIVDEKLVVEVEGDLIGDQNGIDLLKVVEEEIAKGYCNVLVDFSAVRYMNSTGLGVLITLYAKIKREGGSLKVIGASEQIVRLFQITQLDQVFEIESKKIKSI